MDPLDTTAGEAIPDRRLIALSGKDAIPFLQGLVTNDMSPLEKGPGLVWTALLTAQGKYLVDFFVARTADGLLIDLPAPLADATLRRLSMYKLRADVALAPSPLHPVRGIGETPPDALPDPRHPNLGWRAYRQAEGAQSAIDWNAIRVEVMVPEAGIELIPDDSYILELGFERLHGVDFRKGCYVGQEVTARMKHKTELRKGLVRVSISGEAAPGTTIAHDGKEVGVLGTRSGDRALAWLRYDRMAPGMTAGAATLDPE